MKLGETETIDSILCDFLLQATRDLERGRLQALSIYLARFPGHEAEIAREFLAFVDATTPSTEPAPAAIASVDPREHLARARAPIDRYEVGAEIGCGGMGTVHTARDVDLDRELAMKIVRRDGASARRRFLAEAHVTGRLDHPGVVPVHEVGVDHDGRLFFTMRLVEGLDFEDVIRLVHEHDAEWTLARALEVLIKVCDTTAFAHSKGVVHRDLKPTNVRVGRFGEAYVMDWGLAHSDGVEDERGLGDANEEPLEESPFVTRDGDVLGTPAYMPPEQAAGHIEQVGPRSDVYALGTMLYQILTGTRPYSTGREQRHAEVLELVRAGPPRSVPAIAPRAPRELAAICDKAMRRDPDQRYVGATEMARDLRAFLDRRVVQAHDAGFAAHIRKWIARNSALSVVIACAGIGAIIAGLVVGYERAEARSRLVYLSGSQLAQSFDDMWPPSRESVPVLERWLSDVSEYLASRDDNLQRLNDLRKHALPMNPERPTEIRARAEMVGLARRRVAFLQYLHDLHNKLDQGVNELPEGWSREYLEEQTAFHERRAIADREKPTPHKTFEFTDRDDQHLHDALVRILDEQAAFVGDEQQLSLVRLADFGLRASRTVEHDSLETARAAWDAACAVIRDVNACPMYNGLELKPQSGLVPIGRDPESGLFEFAHVLSGRPAERGSDGKLVIYEDTGMVFVLIPGGRLWRGSQAEDPSKPNFDPWAEPDAPTGSSIDLDPFFLSKYEMTQVQWQHVTGSNPSARSTQRYPQVGSCGMAPVENVDWTVCQRVTRVLGLALPNEAQWEWAARGGTSTPWWCGDDPCTVTASGNVADLSAALEHTALVADGNANPDATADDGFAIHALIGTFAPNHYGLHDVIGNVKEWCCDRGFFGYAAAQIQMLNGERLGPGDGTQVVRGGGFGSSVFASRSAHREQCAVGYRAEDLGLRPSRELTR